MDKNTKDILVSLDFIKKKVEQLPTTNEVRAIVHDEVPGIIQEFVPGIVALELRSISVEVRDIARRLDVLDDHYRNIRGFAKEIDDIRQRVKEIEKHLGLNKKIAA